MLYFKNKNMMRMMTSFVVDSFNPRTEEAEAGGPLSSGQA